MLIRAARLEDAPEVVRLLRGRARHDGEPVDHIHEETVRRDICGPDACVCAAVLPRQSGLAGVALWHFAYEAIYAARGAYVGELFVESAHRGLGYGRALLAHVARHTRAAGGDYLWIMAHSDNVGARGFYRRIADIENESTTSYAITRTAFDALCAAE